MKKKAVTNKEALELLRTAGYKKEDFYIDDVDLPTGMYVPLQLWTKYVGKFTTAFKRNNRVQLNLESTRAIGRRNQDHVEELVKSLGIGNGNTYPLDPMPSVEMVQKVWPYGTYRVESHKQPITVGRWFITNIIQAHRKAKEMADEGLLHLRFTYNEDEKECEGMSAKELETWMADHRYRYSIVPYTPDDFYEKIILESHGVVRHVKQPYGYITGVYVYFTDYWERKREARFHVTFDHGARTIITNDWITRSFSTPVPMNQTLRVCSGAGQFSICKLCQEAEVHLEHDMCGQACINDKKAVCAVVQDYDEQVMNVVFNGPTFTIPKPSEEPMNLEEIRAQVQEQITPQKQLLRALSSGESPDNMIDDLLRAITNFKEV